MVFFGGGERVCARWVELHVIAEKMKICSYYPQDDS